MRRQVLVTGATSGIGRAITQRLLRGGHKVVGVGRDFSKFSPATPSFRAHEIDLGRLEILPQSLDALTKAHTDLDAVVCCAGAGRFGSLEEFSFDQIRTLIELNLTSQVYVVRAVLPLLKRHAGGDILFIGSEAAISGGRRGAVYSATKFALRGLAQSLRQECAGRGVRVGIINPGMVKTEFYQDLAFGPGEVEDNYILPEDVADVVYETLMLRSGTVIDEINLSPLKKVVRSKGSSKG